MTECIFCSGIGQIKDYVLGYGREPVYVDCRECNGTGHNQNKIESAVDQAWELNWENRR